MNLFVSKTLNGYKVRVVQQMLLTGAPKYTLTSLLLKFSYELPD